MPTCKCGAAVGPSGRCAKGHLQSGHAHRFGKGNTAARKSRAKRVVEKVVEAFSGPKPDYWLETYSSGELVSRVPVYWKRWDQDEWDDDEWM